MFVLTARNLWTRHARCSPNCRESTAAEPGGHLVAASGRTNGTQTVPVDWIERISTPAVTFDATSDQTYAAQWWHPWGADAPIAAVGIYGQYVFVDPATRTVVVKFSDHGTEQDEDETLNALRHISRYVSR